MGLENLSLLGGTLGLAPNGKHQAMLNAAGHGVSVEDYREFLAQQGRLKELGKDYERQLAKL